MNINLGSSCRGRKGAFSLTEVVIAMALVALLVVGNMGVAYMTRIQDAKNRELGIMSDFATHYFEMVRGQPFDEVEPGRPVNYLYDGANGAPAIPIPANPNWFSIDTASYHTFHPDLVWLTNRNPELSLTMTTTTNAGRATMKHLNLQLRWQPPFNRGATQFLRLDMLRVRDA